MAVVEITKRLERLRRICLAYPETNERPSHGMPTFFVRDKSTFVMLAADHHGDGRVAMWCAAPDGAQEALTVAEPDRYFRPPYVGARGWIGVRLERPDWKVVESVVDDAYRKVAPRKLLALLSEGSAPR
jgi:hypothetical protein